MARSTPGFRTESAEIAVQALRRVEILALFPLIVLAATWAGYDNIAVLTACALSALVALALWLGRQDARRSAAGEEPATGRAGLVAMLDRIAAQDGQDTVCVLLEIDDWPRLVDRWGHDTSEGILIRVKDRLEASLRSGDMITRVGDARFGIVLEGVNPARLAMREKLTSRLADTVKDPIMVLGASVRLAACLGHSALIRRSSDPAGATLAAAEAALADAIDHGPAAIRAYAPNLGRARRLTADLTSEAEAALHGNAIDARFQPQICARTGRVLGMEALARWKHPVHGLLSPMDFLPAVEAAGMMPLLGQTILDQSLRALAIWDKAGAEIPTVSVNFSTAELRDPSLPQQVSDALEKHGITTDRLIVEILETVSAKTADDTILMNLDTLREAGHPLDLDDFGIGQASLAAIQRFGVHRLKIDRSFVIGADGDPGQQRCVRAILAMAHELGVQTLAEGVETPEEIDTLRDLGVDALQGFCVARPLRVDHVADWAKDRQTTDPDRIRPEGTRA